MLSWSVGKRASFKANGHTQARLHWEESRDAWTFHVDEAMTDDCPPPPPMTSRHVSPFKTPLTCFCDCVADVLVVVRARCASGGASLKLGGPERRCNVLCSCCGCSCCVAVECVAAHWCSDVHFHVITLSSYKRLLWSCVVLIKTLSKYQKRLEKVKKKTTTIELLWLCCDLVN